MIFQYPHPWYFRLLALHVAWDILPYALDRVLAGELNWREIPDYIRFALAVEASEVEVMVGDAVVPFQVTPEGRKYLVLQALADQGAFDR